MKLKSGPKIALWAVDPYEGKIKPNQIEVQNLLNWMAEIKVKIQPVYILKSEQREIAPPKIGQLESAMRQYLEGIGSEGTLPPKVLISNASNTDGLVDKLVQYSEDIGSEIVIVSSRGRRGLDRFVFGSFAEALLLKSKQPLFFLTHQSGMPTEERTNRVLFPTDFSKHSEIAFDVFLEQTRPSHTEIILYYAIAVPSSTILTPENYFSQLEEDVNAKAKQWIEKAKSLDLKATFVVENVGIASNIVPSIIFLAKQKAARFIAMASNSGKTGALLFGSTAREVFRANLFPVWTAGPCKKTG